MKLACLVLALGLCACSSLSADITVEMKSSISGIPFLRVFELNQITGMRGKEVITATKGEMNVGDTAISFKSSTYLNTNDNMFRFCNWTDSTCQVFDLTGIDKFLSSDTVSLLLDTLDFYLDIASQYVSIEKAEMERTGKSQTISGYNCDEVIYTLEGRANPPIERLPGDFKFSISGTSWITDDFPHYDEYRRCIGNATDLYLNDELYALLKRILGKFGIGASFLDQSIELWQYLYVEMAMNIKLELWSEGMDVPSMAFNIRFNSVLVDLSFDKISDSVMEPPDGFEMKKTDLSKILK
jgi:hypothetical protein